MANNFIEDIVEKDLKKRHYDKRVHTRFPPEPNGYLHIGHAKSMCLNFELAQKYGGKCNLRFDDTNPSTEKQHFVETIQSNIRWLGFDWEERLFHSSDYFQRLYELAKQLIKKGLAYVDDSSSAEITQMRGKPTVPGTPSPYRDRPLETNLELFEAMYRGEYAEGSKVLRAKIDLASPNMHLRDPVIFRIKKTKHHRLKTDWYVFPMYDFAHCISDSLENITHSLCTLEFEVHRPLYDWFITKLELYAPRQIEFARLNLTYTLLSKRKLATLVEQKIVAGWDDPRMPTLSGMRRRGYPPEAIKNFARSIGIAKRENVVEFALLEYHIREYLNRVAARRLVVLDPIKVIITNYPDAKTEELRALNNPGDETDTGRLVPFSKQLYIERTDFREEAPRKYFRLKPAGFVRLKYAYIIQCEDFEKDAAGKITTLYCRYFPDSRSGQDKSGIKVKGTIHWVCARQAIDVEVNLYDKLFNRPDVSQQTNYLDFINSDSIKTISAKAEPNLLKPGSEIYYQFERLGYFCKDSKSEYFNRTVTLKEGWKPKPKTAKS